MKGIRIILILIACVNFLQAQNPLVKQWDQDFGGKAQDYIYSFQQTSDGGYILGGASTSDSSGNKTQSTWGGADFWIVKTDSLGDKQWDRDFGGLDDDELSWLEQTRDGGYILGGYSSSGISGDKTQADWDSINYTHDYWVIKIDSLGNKQWDKDFGGLKNDILSSIQQTAEGGYILGGYSFSDSSGNKTENTFGGYDYWVVKIDSIGNYQWDKDFGGTGDDELTCLTQTTDGGYLLGGVSNSGISGSKTLDSYGGYDYWVIKIDSVGDEQWEKEYGGTEDDLLYGLELTTDGGYILAGTAISGISGNKTQPNWDTTNTTSDYWIIKIDPSGNIQWQKDFGGTNIEESIGNVSQTSDGGYLVGGTSYSSISGDKTEANLGIEQTWVVKTDINGTKQWDKTIFLTDEDESGYALQTQDGGYIMANYNSADSGGYKTENSFGFNDYWIVKFRDTTALVTGVKSVSTSTNELTVYPNPCTSEISIAVQKQNIKSALLYTVYNVLGQPVIICDGNKLTDGSTNTIDVHGFPSGIYFMEVIIDGERMMKKIVKE